MHAQMHNPSLQSIENVLEMSFKIKISTPLEERSSELVKYGVLTPNIILF